MTGIQLNLQARRKHRRGNEWLRAHILLFRHFYLPRVGTLAFTVRTIAVSFRRIERSELRLLAGWRRTQYDRRSPSKERAGPMTVTTGWTDHLRRPAGLHQLVQTAARPKADRRPAASPGDFHRRSDALPAALAPFMAGTKCVAAAMTDDIASVIASGSGSDVPALRAIGTVFAAFVLRKGVPSPSRGRLRPLGCFGA
jgi:hypothetical protein